MQGYPAGSGVAMWLYRYQWCKTYGYELTKQIIDEPLKLSVQFIIVCIYIESSIVMGVE